VFAFEADSKSDSKNDSLSARRSQQGIALRFWHPHQKTKPQKDLRLSAASCDLVRGRPKLPE